MTNVLKTMDPAEYTGRKTLVAREGSALMAPAWYNRRYLRTLTYSCQGPEYIRAEYQTSDVTDIFFPGR